MTIREALIQGTAKLGSANMESPGLDAALLLAFTLNTVKEKLLLHDHEPLDEAAAELFTSLLDRRKAGECTAWLLGCKEFYGLEFKVTPDVLVPRPDTETLVEAALTVLAKAPFLFNGPPKESAASASALTTAPSPSGGPLPKSAASAPALTTAHSPSGGPLSKKAASIPVLDLCTGSGAVAITLKYQCPELEVYAADISPKALAIARENTRRLLAARLPATPSLADPAPDNSVNFHEGDPSGNPPPPDNSVRFLEGDLFAALPPDVPLFALITANPPYIPTADIAGLSPEVQLEPLLALDGGRDGLDLIRRILEEAPARLLPGGALLLEADPRQMTAIALILEKKGYRSIRTFQDLSGRDRVIGAVRPD